MKASKHLEMLRGVEIDVQYGEVTELTSNSVPPSETKLRALMKNAKEIEKARVAVNKYFDRELKKATKLAEGLAAKEEEKA